MPNFTAVNPREVATIQAEQAKNPANLGVGVADLSSGAIRLFLFDDTNAWVANHPHAQAIAGHEAAAVMAGFQIDPTRGFVLAWDAANGQWQVLNRSHLNLADGNGLRMDLATFGLIVKVLENAGLANPVVFP